MEEGPESVKDECSVGRVGEGCAGGGPRPCKGVARLSQRLSSVLV